MDFDVIFLLKLGEVFLESGMFLFIGDVTAKSGMKTYMVQPKIYSQQKLIKSTAN